MKERDSEFAVALEIEKDRTKTGLQQFLSKLVLGDHLGQACLGYCHYFFGSEGECLLNDK